MLSVPAIAKVLIIFMLILAINRAKLHLGVALIFGAITLAMWFGYGVSDALLIALKGMIATKSLLLYVVIFQIVLLSSLMETTGTMKRLLDCARTLVPSRRALLALLPALIGLLPMPGGAAFSAPMVDAADEDNSIDPEVKNAVNYWFRHVWEYWWPLYPGAILALDLSGLSFFNFFLVEAPLTVLSVIFGTIFILLPLKMGTKRKQGKPLPWLFLRASTPIVLVPAVSFLSSSIGKSVFDVDLGNYVPMALGLLASLTWMEFETKVEWKSWAKMIKNSRTYSLLLIVSGIVAFSSALESPTPTHTTSNTDQSVLQTDSTNLIPATQTKNRIVDKMRDNLADWHIPSSLVAIVIPFLSGLITGLAYGFVGTSFPIVMALVGDGASTARVMSFVVLGYGCGYIGMMLSPVHVCLLVSNQYFGVRIMDAYKRIIWPAVCVFISAITISYFVGRLG